MAICQYNPILNKCKKEVSDYLYDPELRTILDSQDLNKWECSICYCNIKNTVICIPFVCSHILCFHCFKQYCYTFTSNNRVDKVKCPTCRSIVRNNWIRSIHITRKKYISNDILCNLFIPR